MDEDRLVRQVALEVLRTRGKVRWLKELEQSLEKFEWQNVRMEDLERMSLGEVKCMLTDSAVRVVKLEWEEEAKIRSKLQMMGRLMEYDCKARCMCGNRKEESTAAPSKVKRGNCRAKSGNRQVEQLKERRKNM